MTPTASTVLNKSPQKVRLMIDPVRNKRVDEAMEILKSMNKGKTKKVYDLVKNAANNLQLPVDQYNDYKIATIVAEEAQILYRIRPRARGSAFRIRRRSSRIKIVLEKA